MANTQKNIEQEINKSESIMKAKTRALKKIESTLKKSLKALAKDLNKTLKDAGVWYSSDDLIKEYEDFRKPNDRNGDQLIIDYATHILNGGELCIDDVKKLWTKEDISK